jgi:homocysteine S-methyltransferase
LHDSRHTPIVFAFMTSNTVHDILAPWLDNGQVIVLDGAMATELERRGANLDDPLWSARVLLDDPQLIVDVHRDYLDAGADIITTASYQASLPGLTARGLTASAAADVIRLSAQIAVDTRDEWLAGASRDRPAPLVAASLGPYGAHLHDGSEYHGRYGVPDRVLADFHRRHLELLCDTDADLIAVETLPGKREAEISVEILRELAARPAWVSFSCRDENHTSRGEVFAEAIATIAGESHVVATGLNCTAPKYVARLLGSAAQVTQPPLLAYPNSGETWQADGNQWTGVSGKHSIADYALEWQSAGARLIGGCCRTNVLDISQLCAAIAR